MADAKEILVNSGCICMHTAETRVSLNKGYTSQGFAERVFHIHLRYAGDHDELYFRDYMAPQYKRKARPITDSGAVRDAGKYHKMGQ